MLCIFLARNLSVFVLNIIPLLLIIECMMCSYYTLHVTTHKWNIVDITVFICTNSSDASCIMLHPKTKLKKKITIRIYFVCKYYLQKRLLEGVTYYEIFAKRDKWFCVWLVLRYTNWHLRLCTFKRLHGVCLLFNVKNPFDNYLLEINHYSWRKKWHIISLHKFFCL